ncbi:MAG TPA: flavin reductase family protein [Firmicutes bacterium]|nr:flavin reductase family protein [Bacillota bacterium]
MINVGCVLLVTSAAGDRRNVMSLAWQTPVSSQPSLVGIAVARTHFTAELIAQSREFVLNVPGADLLPQVGASGSISGRAIDKFEKVKITAVPAQVVQAPLIRECLGHVECRVVEQHTLGDHIFFVGEIVAASANQGLFEENRWHEQVQLLHHLGGDHYYLAGNRLLRG